MSAGFDEIVDAASPRARDLARSAAPRGPRRPASPRARDLALRARALIREVFPAVVEVPWPRLRVIGYGIGPRKGSEHFCYIAVSADHINLGFNYGAELPDPAGLLRGPGKRQRHVRIAAPGDLAQPELRRLIEVASAHRMMGRPTAPS